MQGSCHIILRKEILKRHWNKQTKHWHKLLMPAKPAITANIAKAERRERY
jgi:hypothetical protein